MRFVLRFFGFLFSVGAIFFLIGAVGGRPTSTGSISQDLPDHAALANYEPPVMTRVHADRRQPARRIRPRAAPLPADPGGAEARHRRLPVGRGQELLPASAASIPEGIVRAVRDELPHGGQREQGASTITQQVAKNFLLGNEQQLRAQDPRGADRAAHRRRPSRRTASSSSISTRSISAWRPQLRRRCRRAATISASRSTS